MYIIFCVPKIVRRVALMGWHMAHRLTATVLVLVSNCGLTSASSSVDAGACIFVRLFEMPPSPRSIFEVAEHLANAQGQKLTLRSDKLKKLCFTDLLKKTFHESFQVSQFRMIFLLF